MTDYFVSHPPKPASHHTRRKEKKRKSFWKAVVLFFPLRFPSGRACSGGKPVGGVIRNICRKRWRLGKVRFREVIGEATFLGAHSAIDITNWRATVDETAFPPSGCGSGGRGRGGGGRRGKRGMV